MTLPKLLCTLPVVTVAVVITILSHIPSPVMGDWGFELQDKVLHIIGYFGFGLTFSLALHAWKPELPKRRFLWTVLIATALFGCYDEVHQSFVPNRQAGIDDWVADCIGGALSLVGRQMTARISAFVLHFSRSQDRNV